MAIENVHCTQKGSHKNKSLTGKRHCDMEEPAMRFEMATMKPNSASEKKADHRKWSLVAWTFPTCGQHVQHAHLETIFGHGADGTQQKHF